MDGLGCHHWPVDESIKFGRVASWSCVDLDQVRSPVGVKKNIVAKEPVGVIAGLDLLNNRTVFANLSFTFTLSSWALKFGPIGLESSNCCTFCPSPLKEESPHRMLFTTTSSI